MCLIIVNFVLQIFRSSDQFVDQSNYHLQHVAPLIYAKFKNKFEKTYYKK